MAVSKRIERPDQTIKVAISPLSSDLKTKIATAFQAIVTAIKVKHLGE